MGPIATSNSRRSAVVRRLDAGKAIRGIGLRVAQLRAARGLTQAALAELLDVSDKYVQRVEAGTNLSVRSLVAIANALGCSLAGLVASPDPAGRPPPQPRSAPRRPPRR